MKEKLMRFLLINESKYAFDAWKFFSMHTAYKTKSVEDLKKLVYQKSKEASWYFIIASITSKECKSLGYLTKPEMINAALELLNEEAIKYNWTFKLTSPAELNKRLVPFRKVCKDKMTKHEAFETLINGHIGNKNAQKLGTEQMARLENIFKANGKYKTTAKIYLEQADKMISAGLWHKKESIVTLTTIKKHLKSDL